MHSPSSTSPFRRRRWKLLAAATAVPLLAAGLTVAQAPALAAATKPSTPAKPTATHKVTLVTGDVVTVTTMADGRQIADVDRPDNAVGGVKIQEIKGDLYVIPDEAASLLYANKLDRRLFDVTDLIEMGYDDAKSTQVPLIATYTPPKTKTKAADPTAPRGSRLVRKLAGIHGAALSADKRQTRAFWTTVAPQGSTALGSGVAKLWLDGRVKVDLKESVPLIGAPEAWAAGYDGHGVKVAVLDTGIDTTHPDLATQIDGTASFVPGESVVDIHGHGTHVASTIVGTGAASGGDYKGVAPGADLIVGKVLGGVEGSGADSWVVAGMEWAAQQGADIVSMSLGDSFPTDGTDPMSLAVDQLSAQYGTLFVIAAGNAGPQSISAPGAAASALTVAATDKQDALAYFSSTGPLTNGAMKPDISAPGVDITAARSQQQVNPANDGMYWTISGTSMATPHVSGAAAILKQRHPDWTGQQLKEALMSSAKGLADWYSPYEVGTGRVDVAAAIRSTVRSGGTLFFGNYTWPYQPSDTAVTKDLTFTNSGTTDVTLNLALTNTGGAFTLGAGTVTIPAGGTATVPVTGDPQTAPTGRSTGYVIGTDAASGQAVTRTSVGLLKEDEAYDLNIKLVGRDGKPAEGYVGIAQAGSEWPWSIYVVGSATLRMPPGTYTVSSYLDVAGEKADRSGLAVLVDPEVVLGSGPVDVVLDASKARLLETEAPQRSENRQVIVNYNIHFNGTDPWYDVRGGYEVPPMYDDVYVSPTEQMTQGEFIFTSRWRKGEELLSVSAVAGLLHFETLVQGGSTLGMRSDNMLAVYAGKGAAANYSKIKAKGKLVVVERSDEVTAQERTDAAVAAGAKALIVVNNEPGALMEYVGESAIPVATVHRDAGKLLISMAKLGFVNLRVKQTKYTPFVYDLARAYPDQVPDKPLVYKPSQRDLVKIDSRYYNAGRPAEGSGFRVDLTIIPALGFPEREWHPGTRVEWVSPDQEWAESHEQDSYSELPWVMVSGANTFAKGSTPRLDWFAPATRPGMSDSFGVQNSRAQNYMTWNVLAWGSSSETMRLGGYLPWGATPEHLQVFQGDTLIAENDTSGDMQWQEVPAGNLPYRAVLDAERPGDHFRLSTRTHSEWTFMSDYVDSDYFQPFSVLNLDYALESDLHGDVKAGANQQITLHPVSMDHGTVPGQVVKVTLEVSYDDGATWQKVTLTKGADGYWTGSFKAANKAGGFISVRASAETNSGYSVKNEIIRAYGLR